MTLHPEVLAMLEASKGARSRAAMSVAETRNAMLAGRAWQEAAPDIPSRDGTVAGVPVRWYGPAVGPSVVFAHGGRFFSGDLETHDAPLRMLQARTGWRFCAVDYRLAPEHPYPAAVDDVLAVAGEIQPDVVMGDSAGGYLAARAAHLARAAVLIYPMLDPACVSESYRTYWDGPWPNGWDMRRGWRLWGPAEPIDAPLAVPALVVTAGVDPLIDEGTAFAGEHLHFADMHHGFFTQTKLTRSRELIAALAGWLLRFSNPAGHSAQAFDE
ncbi:MAG: alpha/beta hydrolase, partial [Acidobacteria bacterium]|nr:alpha/beta hydrolase [Acidobacteriota bacterium]